MGGKGAAPSNNQMVQFEMQQAAEARAKEEARKKRLEIGSKQINELFGGKPVYGAPTPGKIDLSGATDPGASGASEGQLGPDNLQLKWRRAGAAGAGGTGVGAPQQGPSGGYEIYDPTGTTVASGSDWADLINKTKGMDFMLPNQTGTEGGFTDENFYNPFKVKDLAYYLPQVQTQYGDTLHKTQYDLMRAGLARSTAANSALANIYKQGVDAEGMARRRVDQDVAGLHNQINSEQKSAQAQLQAQEDPEVAATGAINYVANQKLAQPDQPQLGDLFKPLVIGALGAANTYQDVNAQRSGFNARPSLGAGAWSVNQS
jgi:hypothetical protein